ncbi:hypothetical protein DV113_004356 [Geotrichum candidum]|uniref:Acyl-coenzyme A oxidase n=1 Tax=Geotrichum candidum TaxID=1173061 RepID=A0A0J9XKH0_GEOCN|nr:hypothetical protein DV113_004356 [Geotrichum candidum]KAI8131126.1 hypothetical protein DUD61_005216 [Geotrichum candidum]CDO57904.1 similar to Saccharomyces cerevisiae YGL205W POX1 Fatty-acyl coenzyme A oxidase [Geotrichum candidum]
MANRIISLSNALVSNQTSDVVIDGKAYNTETEPKQVLLRERANASFDIRELTHYLNGGPENTAVTERVMTSIERDPLFQNDDFYDLSKDQLRAQTFSRVAALSRYVDPENQALTNQRFSYLGIADTSVVTRAGVHFGLFLRSIRTNGTDEQYKHWVGQGATTLKRFYGCFGMTEMGHGSNVQGLETTATFDPETDEFVINTPHLGATKWWIGGAAHSATHSVVFARLISNGKDYGTKPFVVQLRSIPDFSLQPGVAIGDIGKKMGRDGVDNGWIQFTHVRIPRSHLLQRYVKVDPKGNVTQPPAAQQLGYAALVDGRVTMVNDSFQSSKRFLTIALRYAAIRRQFGKDPKDNGETRILDYPHHQRRLLPRLALTYAMNAAAFSVSELQTEAGNALRNVDVTDKVAFKAAIEESKELFSDSAGLKAFTTWATSATIDECRQACGGHGYSGYSGFGQGYNDWAVMCTWEGDNNVLTLSTGRSLIQSNLAIRRRKANSTAKVPTAIAYLLRSEQLKGVKLGSRSLNDPKVLVEAWESIAASTINRATDAYERELAKNGGNVELAFETVSQRRFEAATVHTKLYLVASFVNRIEATATPGVKSVLTDLAVLLGLWLLEADLAKFLQSGFLTSEQSETVSDLVDSYTAKIRTQAIPLTDAFNLSDYFINSGLGNYDGDVYNHYFSRVVRRSADGTTSSNKKDARPEYFERITSKFLFRED